jgi:hypothetical protein
MRRLVLSALALVAACGTRPDPQRLAAVEKAALRGEAGVVARRLLSEAQFNDHGYPTADGRFISTIDMSTAISPCATSTGAMRPVGLKRNGWASRAYVETSIMSPDGPDRASWSTTTATRSASSRPDGRNARVVYQDSAYYYMEVNGFSRTADM